MSRRSSFARITGLILLSSCNTTDALTPQVDIPNVRSTPVTQQDLDRLARDADRPPAARRMPDGGLVAHAPQNTLDAQARALAGGAQYGRPLTPPPPASPAAMTAPSPAPAAAGAAAQAQASIAPAPSASAGSIRFLPVIGAPLQAVTPLSRQLGAEARAKGLTILTVDDHAAENVLKGYFSAFSEGNKVNVVYVWDVLDDGGNRLHRLQGQETVPARGTDPWSAVGDMTMQQIAARTLNDYIAWKQSRPGPG